MAEKKFEDYPRHIKVISSFGLLLYVGCFIWWAWTLGMHLYREEWKDAAFQVIFFLLVHFWVSNRRKKRKIKRLEEELNYVKTRQASNETASFMKGWEAGIDFQRRILIGWTQQRRQT